MEITQKQAQETLQDVEAVAKDVQAKLFYGPAGPILLVWGVVWIVCFAISHFAPRIAGWGWTAGDCVGFLGTFYVGRFRGRSQVVRSESSKRLGRRLFWFWMLLFVFGSIWLAILWPWQPEQVGTFLVTLVMFAYVVMGLWLGMPFLLRLGLAVTALAGGGYALSLRFPGYQDLWLGFTGGSARLGSGFYLMRRWR